MSVQVLVSHVWPWQQHAGAAWHVGYCRRLLAQGYCPRCLPGCCGSVKGCVGVTGRVRGLRHSRVVLLQPGPPAGWVECTVCEELV
jgi:hypothetical protein